MVKSAMKLFVMSVLFLASSAFAQNQNGPKEWTMLVFLNGHNNLDSYGKMNIKQMEEVGSSDQVNVVVQWATMSANTKRYYITKSTNNSQVTSTVVENMGKKVDMGSAQELYNFVKWGMEKYPAKKYFVDVWNHGSGWHRNEVDPNLGRDISFDDISGNHITTESLGKVFRQIAKETGKPVELYGSDACLMSMIEVAGEMAGGVNYFVGSQDLEPGEGWPYNAFLKQWVKNPTIDGAELGKLLVKEYTDAYNSGGVYGDQDVTFSAFNLNQYGAVINVMKQLSKNIQALNPAQVKKLKASLNTVQSFYNDDYRDLKDFVMKLPAMGVNMNSDFAAEFNTAFSSFVISEQADENYIGAFGLSFWLPTSKESFSEYSERYSGLNFSQNSGWGEALQFIFK